MLTQLDNGFFIKSDFKLENVKTKVYRSRYDEKGGTCAGCNVHDIPFGRDRVMVRAHRERYTPEIDVTEEYIPSGK